MPKQHVLVVAATLLVAFVASCSAADASAGTAYDVLVKNNFPRGLLPKGVKSYSLSPDGTINVTLPNVCDFPVTVGGQAYKMRFDNTVGGIIKPGSIQQTFGVRVQVSYAWLGISGISRTGNQIEFSVQQGKPLPFPVSNFAVSPSCS